MQEAQPKQRRRHNDGHNLHQHHIVAHLPHVGGAAPPPLRLRCLRRQKTSMYELIRACAGLFLFVFLRMRLHVFSCVCVCVIRESVQCSATAEKQQR